MKKTAKETTAKDGLTFILATKFVNKFPSLSNLHMNKGGLWEADQEEDDEPYVITRGTYTQAWLEGDI